MRRDSWCRHYNGFAKHEVCSVGVRYDSLSADVEAMKRPCICAGTPAICAKFSAYTREEIAARNKKLAELFEKMAIKPTTADEVVFRIDRMAINVCVLKGFDRRPPAEAVMTCRYCGCTDDNCKVCVAATGSPCYWVAPNVCSACTPYHVDVCGHWCAACTAGDRLDLIKTMPLDKLRRALEWPDTQKTLLPAIRRLIKAKDAK